MKKDKNLDLANSKFDEACIFLEGIMEKTPVLTDRKLCKRLERDIWVKAECLQETGSFKLGAALYVLHKLGEEARRRGVVAFSAGNYGAALACAGAKLGVPVLIVAPNDAPKTKLENIAAYGAEISESHVNSIHENRELAASNLAKHIATTTGRIHLHPFEDYNVIASHSFVARETISFLLGSGRSLNRIYVPAGGGGILAGTLCAVRLLTPKTEVVAIEPAGFEGICVSLKAGKLRSCMGTSGSTICDALHAPSPGQIPFDFIKEQDVRCLAVTNQQITDAMVCAFDHFHIALEPSGAISLAGLLADGRPVEGGAEAVIATGGNVEFSTFRELVNAYSND